MSEHETKNLRDELIGKMKTGHEGIDGELRQLRMIAAGEQERADRLARWTKRAWLGAAGCVVLGMIVPTIGYMMAEGKPGTTSGGGWRLMGPLMAGLFFLGIPALVGCVVVGIVLLVLTFFARRTAGMQEIRASLASIDAQLRLLVMGREVEGEKQT
jgi:hypothetical protein